MAHGDYRIEIVHAVAAPAGELERSILLARVSDQILALQVALTEVSGETVTVTARAIRENSRTKRRAARPQLAAE